ncbi:hypothetical protein ACWKSP_28240 [Micromonosporaceae bacterium Da 78-11]
MRGTKRFVLVLTGLVAAVVLGVVVVVVVTLHRTGQDMDRGEREAQARISAVVDAYARQVVAISRGPVGPAETELAALSERASIRYVRDQRDGMFRSLNVLARDSYPAPLGGVVASGCSTIDFNGLGTATAAYAVHPLPDCAAVTAALNSPSPTPPSR